MGNNTDKQNECSSWAAMNFGNNDFNDQRLNRRGVNIAEAIMTHPKNFVSGLYMNASDSEAAYRFLRNEKTSFDSVTETHRNNTYQAIMQLGEQAQAAGEKKPVVLLVGDTSEVNFGYKRKIKGAGPIGEHNQGKGFVLHTNLAFDWNAKQLIGMASALLKNRTARPKQKNGRKISSYQRALIPDRESALWIDSKKGLKPLLDSVELVCVNDRGADFYEYISQLNHDGFSYVIRAAQKDRVVASPENPEQRIHLYEYICSQSVQGEQTIEVTGQIVKNKKQPYRKSPLLIRSGSVLLLPSAVATKSLGKGKQEPFKVNFVHIQEDSSRSVDSNGKPCEVKEAVEWILLTNRPVSTVEDALEIRNMYQSRWLIEEYFCALKSGCGLEDSQLQSADSLKTLCGFYSVCAVFILSLKYLQNFNPETDVYTIIPKEWIVVLQQKAGSKFPIKTARDFYIGLAKLGGYLNRKNDAPPGWKRIWNGFSGFLPLVEGYKLAMELFPEKNFSK